MSAFVSDSTFLPDLALKSRHRANFGRFFLRVCAVLRQIKNICNKIHIAGVAAILAEAVLFDNQTPLFELLQSGVNGFYLDTALLGNQVARRIAAVVLVILVTDQTSQHSEIARLESE